MRRSDHPLVSVAIPCYEMHGHGTERLLVALESIARQEYRPVEAVVSDHSVGTDIERLCAGWAARMDLRYVRNDRRRGSSSANVNCAMQHARGDLLKILCQDDYLADDGALGRIVESFPSTSMWHVASYVHTRDYATFTGRVRPRLTAEIALYNTIGTHSCLTVRRHEDLELFDESLIWHMDSEYYRRLHDRFGPPIVLDDVTVAQLLWEGQVTNTLARARRLRRAEARMVVKKHPRPIPDLPHSSMRGLIRSRLASIGVTRARPVAR